MCTMLKLGSRECVLVHAVDPAVQICFSGGMCYKRGRVCEKLSVSALMKFKSEEMKFEEE